MTSATGVATPGPSIWQQASAAAADWCTAVLIVGVSGILIAQGHDGLAYALGIFGAAFVWAAILVPIISSSMGIPGYLASRHASAATGIFASIVTLTALAGLLAAELTALASILGLAGFSSLLAFTSTLAAAGAGFALAASGRPRTRVAAIVPWLIASVLLVALVVMSYRDGLGALVSIPAMADITSLEQTLLEKRLADPATFKPHAVPFLRTDALNFAMLICTLSLGLALMARPRMNSSTTDALQISRLSSRALIVVTCILLLLPPLAAAAKRSLLALFASGVRPVMLPDWMNASLQSSMLQICGTSSTDPAALVKACGKGVGPQGLMRWHEAVFASDTLLFSGLQAASPDAAILIFALASVTGIAAMWSSRRIAILAMDAAAHLTVPALSMPLAVLILLAAALIAYAKPDGAVTLMTWTAAFAAAALAPATFAAIFTRKPSAFAANAAILIGAITTLTLILAARYAPLDLAAWTNGLAAAPPSVMRKLATLQDAWAAAAEGPGKDALRVQAEKLARDNLNWFGVRPVSLGIPGLALGGIIVLLGAVLSSVRLRKPS